jgi:hypothetical protein
MNSNNSIPSNQAWHSRSKDRTTVQQLTVFNPGLNQVVAPHINADSSSSDCF